MNPIPVLVISGSFMEFSGSLHHPLDSDGGDGSGVGGSRCCSLLPIFILDGEWIAFWCLSMIACN